MRRVRVIFYLQSNYIISFTIIRPLPVLSLRHRMTMSFVAGCHIEKEIQYSSQRKKQSSNWIVNKPGRHHLNQVTEVNNIVSNGAKEALCAPWGGLLRTHNVLPVLLVLTKCITRLSETASDRLNLRNILQNKPHTHTQPQQWKAKIEELSQIKRLKRRDNTV